MVVPFAEYLPSACSWESGLLKSNFAMQAANRGLITGGACFLRLSFTIIYYNTISELSLLSSKYQSTHTITPERMKMNHFIKDVRLVKLYTFL